MENLPKPFDGFKFSSNKMERKFYKDLEDKKILKVAVL